MNRDTDHLQDDKTVLLDREGHRPASRPVTNAETATQIGELKDRMIYSARQRPSEAFSIGLNSLVAAATELLFDVVRFKYGETRENITALHAELTTKLKNFEARAAHNGIERSQVKSAHYVLCTAIDEAVRSTSWGTESGWSRMSLLSSFHKETTGGENFFQLLDRFSKDPVRHLPMLELMYVCLSLGFEGKYGMQPRGALELEDVRDALYRQIRHLRGDVPRELSPHWQGLGDQRRNLVRIVPAWMVVLFTLVCLAVMYSGFAWVLGEQRDNTLQPYQSFEPAAAQPQTQP